MILIGHGENFEEWLLKYGLDYKDKPKKYEKANSHFEIIHND